MSFRLLLGIAFATLLGCASKDTSGTSTSGKVDKPVDLNAELSYSECKKRCVKRLGQEEGGCGETSAESNKNCNAICLDAKATGHQMACLDETDCKELDHESKLAEHCPTKTKTADEN